MSALTHLAALPLNYVVSLENRACIQVKGEQRDSYLHGQLTVNINKLDDSTVRLTAHCDNKGKTWSVLSVLRHDNAILLLTNRDAAQKSLAELKKYGVFSKVEFSSDEKEYMQFFVSEALANAACENLFGLKAPATGKTLSNELGVAASAWPAAGVHLILTAKGHAAFSDWLQQQDSVTQYRDEVYEALCIQAGIPDISAELINEYVPQMFNLQALNGIDFDKGCYMGQEVIARTKFLGKNKRAAYTFSIQGNIGVKVADEVEKQLGDNWRRGGKVIRCANLGNESYFMAVLANDTQADDVFRLLAHPTFEVNAMTLPYSVEPEVRSPLKPGAKR